MSNVSIKERSWYVIYTKSNYEKKINRLLNEKDIDTFFPLKTVKRQWSDRVKHLQLPLFPNYMFINANLKEKSEIYEIPGFVRFVPTGTEDNVLPEDRMHKIKTVLNEPELQAADVCEKEFTMGERVRVIDGPLKNMEGILTGFGSSQKLVLKVDIVNQYVKVNVPAGCLESIVEEVV